MSLHDRVWVVGLVVVGVLWMTWPLPLELGTAWTSARAEGDLAWSLVLHDWTTDAVFGAGTWSADPRVWHPHGGSLATSAWNLVALLSTSWLGIGTEPLTAWHRSMLFIGMLNGLGGAWLGARVGGRAGSVVGAIACACAPLAWFEMCEGRLEQGLIGPLAVWMAEAWALSRSPRPVLAGLALALVAATYWFLGPIALVVGLVLPLIGPHRSTAPLRAHPRRLLWGLLVCAGVVAVALLPVASAAWSGAQNAAVVDPMLGRVQRLASGVSPWALLTGGPLPAHRLPLVALPLLPLAWRHAALRPWVAAMGLAGVLAAGSIVAVDQQPLLIAGMELSLPLRLFDVLPSFQRFWWPDRIVALVAVAAAGGLAAGVALLPARLRWPGVAVIAALWAIDGRAQLRAAVGSGDPRIPASPLDPDPTGGFFARPTVPSAPGTTPAIIGPWSTTANIIPLVLLETGRPLVRGDGAADRRLWPTPFATHVDHSPVLTALSTGATLSQDTLQQGSFDTILWLGDHQRDAWTTLLGCEPVRDGPWASWDRSRPECR